MSLLYWYPLVKDGINQGLLQSTALSSSLDFTANGKIGGKCLTLTSNLSIATSNPNINIYSTSSTAEVSYSMWVKIDKTYLNSQIASLDLSTKDQIYNKIMGFADNSTSCGLCFEMKTIDNLTNSTVLNQVDIGGWLRLKSGYGNTGIYTTVNLDEWIHLAISYDKNNYLSFYVNGIRQCYTKATRGPLNSGTGFPIQLNNSYYPESSNYNPVTHLVKLKEYFNDIRIYDHALSAKEVEEIAKGLVLHYKLDGENQILVPPEYQQLEYLESTGTQYINTDRVPQENDEYRFKYSLRAFEGYKPVFSAYSAEASNSTRLICNNGNTTNVLMNFNSKAGGGGKSCAALTTAVDQIIEGSLSKTKYYLHNLSNETIVQDFNNTDLFPTKGNAITGSMKLFGINSSTSTKSRIYSFDVYNNGSCIQKLIPAKRLSDNILGMYEIYSKTFFTNAGTGTFTAGPNIMITGTIYDSSGYQNNGTITGSLTCNTDSSRYSLATNFSAYANYITTPSLALTECSYSLWIKPSAGTDARIIFSDYKSGICFGRSTSYTYCNNTTLDNNNRYARYTIANDNSWQHFVIIRSGEKTITLYKNGELVNPTTTGATWSHNNVDYLMIGRRKYSTDSSYAYSIKGDIVDFREYATVLTESQIQELYNTSALIDKNGNVYLRELVEN